MLFVLIACAILVLVSMTVFLLACYVPTRKPSSPDTYDTPQGTVYDPFRKRMIEWTKEARLMVYEEVSIRSHDGLVLRGRYYVFCPNAPIELMLHGYRGNSERDLSGGVQRAFALGHNALVVDQRAGGRSDGHIITFGVKERYDCQRWVTYITERFGPGQKIILTGISMGASTVLLAGSMDLPRNVIGILADCGYTSAKAIIQKVLRQVGLPRFLYGFLWLGCRVYGGFDLEEAAPIRAVERCTVPVIFFHGEDDDYVPCEMSRQNYEVCRSPKRLVTVPGAGHGLSYPVDETCYMENLKEFETLYWNNTDSGGIV